MVSIGLINPKSAENIASVLRACSGFEASSIFFTGQRSRYAQAFNPDTQQMRKKIGLVGVDSIMEMAPKGSRKVVVELVENAIPLPEYIHPENAFYIFGPEDGTVSTSIINESDDVIFIPCRHNLNLAAAANIVLYDRMAKSHYDSSNNAIRRARDNNNNTRI